MRQRRTRIATLAVVVGLIAVIPASTQTLADAASSETTAVNLELLILVNRMELTAGQMQQIHEVLSGLLDSRGAFDARRAERGICGGRQPVEDREDEDAAKQQPAEDNRFAADPVGQPAEQDIERPANDQPPEDDGIGARRIDFQHAIKEEQHVECAGIEGDRLSGDDAEQGDEYEFEITPPAKRLLERRF